MRELVWVSSWGILLLCNKMLSGGHEVLPTCQCTLSVFGAQRVQDPHYCLPLPPLAEAQRGDALW